MVASAIMVLVLLLLIAFASFVIRRLHNGERADAQNGFITLSAEVLASRPAQLSGGWDAFYGVVCKTPAEVAALGQQSGRAVLPLGSITQAAQDATYRLYLRLPKEGTEDLYLAIPTYSGSLEVYVNGVKQERVSTEKQWITHHALDSVYRLTGIAPEKELQELVITAPFSENANTLYRRPILLGTMQNISTLVVFDSSAELLVMGMLLLVLVSSYVFMLFRPGHTLITMITVFDTLLMGRVLPTMNYVSAVFQGMVPNFTISDQMRVSIAHLFLLVAGFVGCLLAKMLFAPKGGVPRWLVWPPALAYLVFAVLFPFHQSFFEKYGIPMLLFVYAYTFVGVFAQFAYCWKHTDRRGYFLFQFIKTAFVGGVVCFDIIFWTRYTGTAIWLYLYLIFFMMHVIVRLYDNNQSYQSVEDLNHNLENTVAERTKELRYANQILSELSNRDPLTHAFNRLYFEGLIEQLLANPQELYISILDLDYFKNVNDTYGHAAGDEMLCLLTAIVQQEVGEDAVFARIGGEEFVLLYEKLPLEQVLESIGALHRALEKNAELCERYTTASFGVAAWRPGDTEKSLLQKADSALYQAKQAGRNRIALHPDVQTLQAALRR